MTVNSVITSLTKVKTLLEEADILKQINNTRPPEQIVKYISEEYRSVMYGDDYEKKYRIALENGDYYCLLKDDSFLNFNAAKKEGGIQLSYRFYPNPRDYQTYEEFLLTEEFEEFKDDGVAHEFYEQYVSEAKLKAGILPIRYDYDQLSYQKLQHAASHIHFGFSEHMRIPISRIITPIAFTILVIKNIYYCNWQNCYQKEEYKTIEIAHKNKCDELSSDEFCEEEKRYLFLS